MEPVLYLVLGIAVSAVFFKFLTRKNSDASESREKNLEMELKFKELAEESLKRNREEFLQLAKEQFNLETERSQNKFESLKKEAQKEVELLVKPLSETLNKYQKELQDAEQTRSKEYGSLDKMMKIIAESNEALKKETTNLHHALKRPTVRGRWGEIQLRRVVELSGMSAHCDFSEQSSTDAEDSRLRPDMVINLPAGRQIVVDSKAVMDAYLDAEAATTDNERKDALKRHGLAIRSRIKDLSLKSYWDQFKNSPEFVILFIPGEAFFSAALEADPDLVEYGFNQKVVLATPTNLMALLRAVEFGWRQEQMAENSRKISDEAQRIYQGLATWSGHLSKVGSNLESSVKSYNAAVGSLERRVMPPIRRLKELGIQTKDEIKDSPNIELNPRELLSLGADAENSDA